MAFALPDAAVLTQNQRDKKRAQSAATFEVLPRLLGFNEDVILRAVRVDYARNIVHFYFAGPGLSEIEERYEVNLDCFEGQECPEIVPPNWETK